MTGEEMERAITFVLEQQAQLNTSVDRLRETVSTMAEKVDLMAEKVDLMAGNIGRLAEKVDRNAEGITALLAIAEMHEREITENREAQARTDERLNALIDTVERYISERRNGNG
jgi:peptidoglycan hydrolase CwlO-like protein